MSKNSCVLIRDMPRSIACCVARESSRYAINAIKVIQRNGKTFAVATDGRLLVVSVVDCDPPESADIGVGMIPASLLAGGGPSEQELSYCDGEWRNLSTKQYDTEADGAYPPFEEVIPDPKSYIDDGGLVVTLNAAFLKKISDVLGTVKDPNEITLILSAKRGKPICVVGGTGSIAVLMPVGRLGNDPVEQFCEVRASVISEKPKANVTAEVSAEAVDTEAQADTGRR